MRTRSAALLMAALALTSACTGGSEKPQVLPTLTGSPTPSEQPVAIPSDARATTPQALDRFVRYYFASLNEAFSTGNPQIIRDLSSTSCSTCENYAKSLADSNHIVGPTFASVDVAAPPIQPNGTIVEVTGVVPARDVANGAGKIVKHLASSGPFHFQVNVIRVGGTWQVRGIRKVS